MIARGSRYDYILVWGHGIAYLEQILAMIRSHGAFSILRIQHHVPENIDVLVDAVYSFDYAPIEHLRGKILYLKQTPNEVYFIFLENLRPEEDYFGEGPYRHMESLALKTLKERIRDRFNPRLQDGRRSEDHVIHASDNQLQTDHILRYLGSTGSGMFAPGHLALDAPYHLPQICDFTVRRVSLSALRCRLAFGNRSHHDALALGSIEMTPHFQALCGDAEPYRRYLEMFRGTALTDDHTVEKLLGLKGTFRYLAAPYQSGYIIVEEAEPGHYLILDGLHRAALLKYQGVAEVNVAVIDAGDDHA